MDSWRGVAHQAPLSLVLSGKNTGAGCHFLLQEIFLIQGLKPSLLNLLNQQADSLPSNYLETALLDSRRHFFSFFLSVSPSFLPSFLSFLSLPPFLPLSFSFFLLVNVVREAWTCLEGVLPHISQCTYSLLLPCPPSMAPCGKHVATSGLSTCWGHLQVRL